ncbi:Ig-like domain-containing protein [Fulvivirga ligni]|uniref:Ig-like domain-containing protein n=1 Tax=Fulvivirga ligni TaxID=2904246 RepID=UPI001F2285AE|nr:Ig-like domain-containing protein [Fulvivirga ligni]UII19361.1 Ig-like domain-containing protein [Fulvivirga ligni]
MKHFYLTKNVNPNYYSWLTVVMFVLIFQSAQAFDADCGGVPAWSSSQVYLGGSEVTYNGYKYQANYWTQNNNPEQYSDPYEHWTNLGACDGGGGGNTNQPPTVSLTSPSNGASFSSGDNITLSANASDSDGSITKVEFYQGATKLGEDSSSPYSFTWNNVAVGSYSISAKAFDNDNASANSSIVSISVTSSGGGGGSCDGLPQYSAGTSYTQNQEVANVGNKYQCNVPGWCSSSAGWAYAPGTGQHWQDAWSLVGECGGGNGGNEAPSVSITGPSNGSSYIDGATITIAANASDDVAVTKVEFYSNGSYLGEDSSSPYSFTWSNVGIGSYTLTAVADDAETSTTSNPVNISVTSDGSGGGGGDLPDRLLVGYWHNFDNGSGVVKLRDVSAKWDVINIAFAEPTTVHGSSMTFTPDNSIYSSTQEFKNDVAYLQNQGKKVLISIGGANGAIDVSSSGDASAFSSSMINIINTYGFDGMDIDLEGSSLSLGAGDSDFRNPVSAKIVYFIQGAQTVINNYGNDFVLSMAPETAFVQGGYSTYAGIYGAYLPVIYALRNQMDYIHVQHYNSGCMLGLDGMCYSQSTADFHVAMAEMLLQGFPVAGNPVDFPALRQDQVAIGLPASPSAAGGGYTTPANVHKALDYLIKGIPFGGNYSLRSSSGYSNFRGLMTWSINWDINYGYEFSNNHRAYLDALGSAPLARKAADINTVDFTEDFKVYPNPFENSAKIAFSVMEEGRTKLEIYNTLGRKVATLKDEVLSKGSYMVEWFPKDNTSGIYLGRLSVGGEVKTFKIYKK